MASVSNLYRPGRAIVASRVLEDNRSALTDLRQFEVFVNALPTRRAAMGNGPTIAEQPGSGAGSLSGRRARFFLEIGSHAVERRRDNALTRQLLGELDGLARLQAQRQSLLDNLAHLYCKFPRADVSPGVLQLITLFADNDEGACTLSLGRIGRFLSRSEDTVRRALAKLVEAETIVVEPRLGRTNMMTPWVHKTFGEIRDRLTWIMDLRAPQLEAAGPGRPRRNDPATEKHPSQQMQPHFDATGQKAPRSCCDSDSEIPLAPEREIPPHQVQPDSSWDTASEKKSSRDNPDARTQIDIDDECANEFNRLYNAWSVEHRKTNLADRASTDRLLNAELSVFAEEPLKLIRAAFVQALNAARAKAQQGHGRGGGAGMLSYFRKCLRTAVDGLRLGQAKIQAEARAEQAVQQARFVKRMGGVERDDTRRPRGRPSMDDLAAQAFSTMKD